MSNPLILSHETRAAAELREALLEMLAGEEDESLIRDMIEGSTSLVEAIRLTMERIECLEDDVLASDARIKQLQARKASREATVERLKALLHRNLERVPEFLPFREPGRYTLSIAKAPQKLVVDGHTSSLPDDYVRITIEPNKAELKKALKDGVEIDGVRLVDGGTHLVIRRG